MVSRWRVVSVLTLVLGWALAATRAAEETASYFPVLWEKRVPFVAPNDPVVVDLNGDGANEIIISDSQGRLTAYAGATGQILWSWPSVPETGSLTGPVVGHFWGDGTLDVAVADSRGSVYLFNGGNGRLLQQLALNAPIALEPTVVPPDATVEAGGVLNFHPEAKDHLVVLNGETTVTCLVFDPDTQQAGVIWEKPLDGHALAPASVGDVDGDGRFEVVTGVAKSREGLLHVFRADSGTPLSGSGERYASNIVTVASLADTNGDGRDEIFFATKSGHLYGVYYEPAKQRFGPLWEKRSIGQEPEGDPILLHGEWFGTPMVVIRTDNVVLLWPVIGGAASDWIAPARILSGLALASGSRSAKARLVFGDELGNINDLWIEGLRERGSAEGRHNELLSLTPLLADFDGKGDAECLFCFPRQGRMRMVAFPEFPTENGAIAWQTRNGNLWRTGWRDVRYYQALAQRYNYVQQRIEAYLKAAEEASVARDIENKWEKAMEACLLVLDVDPHHRLARKLYRGAWIRQHLATLLLVGVVSLAVLCALLYGCLRVVLRTVGLRRAAELAGSGRLDDAIAAYARVHQRFPRHSRTNAVLARLLIKREHFAPEYVSVFERAYAGQPGDSRLVRALSQCYMQAGAITPEAREVYLKSLDVSDRAAELKFLIGSSFLAQQQFEEAARFLNEARAEGFHDERVYGALADAYVHLRPREAEVLPVLERVYPSRGDDLRFLAYLCEVYLANARSDEGALSCARQTLALDPTCDAAQMLYVQILLGRGQVEAAWQGAQVLYSEKPARPEVLRLVSRCLVALDQRDDNTVQILEKALEHFRDDSKILAHLSHVYLARGWFDPHAAEIHRRAFDLCPEDDRIVEAMALLAERDGDSEALVRHLEKLVALGGESRPVMLRLARAYRDLGIEDERARKAYDVAVQANPDDHDWLLALGKVYVVTGETSPEAAVVLERLHREGLELPGLERHLITALDRHAEHAKLVALCDGYLAANPDDSEVRRIRARTYLATDQLERAVEEFEQLLDRYPEDDQVVTDLALVYAQAGRTDERATSLYGRVLQIPSQPAARVSSLWEVHRALGCAHAKRGDLKEAIAQFQAALELHRDCGSNLVDQCQALLEDDPDRTLLRWFLCDLLIDCGRLREAVDQLKILYDREPEEAERVFEQLGRILDIDTENVHARRVRGGLFLRSERFAEARTDLEAANSLRPGDEETISRLRTVYGALLAQGEDAEVCFRLGRVQREAGDLDSALRCFQKSVRDYRFENESTREMGKVFMEKKLLDLALEEFQKLPVDEDLKEALYQLGRLYEERGDRGGAGAAYRLVFAADAGFRDVQERFEALAREVIDRPTSLERATILSQLSEKAKHRYKLLEEIGRGAMGIVYRAMDSELDEIVALKILPGDLSTNDEALSRFRREARSARRLSHRNIVRIHDIGEEMGRKYISMEFIEGTTLKALISATGGIEPHRVLKYACQILDALAYAHSIGIVHRDIKPANIIISRDDEVKVTDFGIAKILAGTDATGEGAVVGTPLYMSPEQVRGDPVDRRADIYSIGVVLYECIEGKPPFVKGDPAYSHLHLYPEPMSHAFPEFNRIVMRALEKRKEDRWPSAQAVLDALCALELPEDLKP